MAWSMQTHMIQYIKPSIDAHADSMEYPKNWLADIYADLKYVEGKMDTFTEEQVSALHKLHLEEALVMSRDELINYIASAAECYSTTTNGGFRFYVDDHWTVPWCSEEVFLAWNG